MYMYILGKRILTMLNVVLHITRFSKEESFDNQQKKYFFVRKKFARALLLHEATYIVHANVRKNSVPIAKPSYDSCMLHIHTYICMYVHSRAKYIVVSYHMWHARMYIIRRGLRNI